MMSSESCSVINFCNFKINSYEKLDTRVGTKLILDPNILLRAVCLSRNIPMLASIHMNSFPY